MDFFISAFNTILYQPLFNALVFLYQFLPGRDFGVAIIVLTLAIRIVLYPLMVKSIRSQKVLADLQPKIKEIQQKYKNDKEKEMKEIMSLYQKEKINPFGGCLPLLAQFPILIALYRVFREGLEPETMGILYDFISNPGAINPLFLGLVNLGESNFIFAGLAGVSQFFQSKILMFKNSQKQGKENRKTGQMAEISNIIQKQTLYFFPIFTVFILLRLPSAIALYWLTTALFSIGQQYLIFNPLRQTKKIVEVEKS